MTLVALAALAGFLSLLVNWGVVTDWFDFGAFLIRWWLAGLLGVFLAKLPLSFVPTLAGR